MKIRFFGLRIERRHDWGGWEERRSVNMFGINSSRRVCSGTFYNIIIYYSYTWFVFTVIIGRTDDDSMFESRVYNVCEYVL